MKRAEACIIADRGCAAGGRSLLQVRHSWVRRGTSVLSDCHREASKRRPAPSLRRHFLYVLPQQRVLFCGRTEDTEILKVRGRRQIGSIVNAHSGRTFVQVPDDGLLLQEVIAELLTEAEGQHVVSERPETRHRMFSANNHFKIKGSGFSLQCLCNKNTRKLVHS